MQVDKRTDPDEEYPAILQDVEREAGKLLANSFDSLSQTKEAPAWL